VKSLAQRSSLAVDGPRRAGRDGGNRQREEKNMLISVIVRFVIRFLRRGQNGTSTPDTQRQPGTSPGLPRDTVRPG